MGLKMRNRRPKLGILIENILGDLAITWEALIIAIVFFLLGLVVGSFLHYIIFGH